MYLKNWWGVQTFKICPGNFLFSLNLKADFKYYVPPYTFIFCRMGFCIFQMFLLLYRMPVMCLELQKIRHFRCLPLSSVTWSFSHKLIVCRQSKFYFLMANLCCSFFHYFFFSFRIIQRIFMLSNKSFIVYCTVLITITNVQDIKEPWFFVM